MNKKLIYSLLFAGGLLVGLIFASSSGIKLGKCSCCPCGCCNSFGINFPSDVKCECKKPDNMPVPTPTPRPQTNPFNTEN